MNVRGERTRTRLVQATIDVVAEVGYARATTKAIAEAAGVAEGTIYRHFPDKRQLFYAAVMDRNTAVLDWITALPQRAGTGTVRGNLREALLQLGRLRTDLLPLELWLRSDPELSKELAAAFAAVPRLGDLLQPPGPGDGAAASASPQAPSADPGAPDSPVLGPSTAGPSTADASTDAPPAAPSTDDASTDGPPVGPSTEDHTMPGALPHSAAQPGAIPPHLLPVDLAVTGPGLPGPPQFIARYLSAERDLGRIRADAQPEQVAVLLLVILFGVAMSQFGVGLDERLIGVAVDTVLDGIGPLPTGAAGAAGAGTGPILPG
jgi:AcrR family transcriptional regulator